MEYVARLGLLLLKTETVSSVPNRPSNHCPYLHFLTCELVSHCLAREWKSCTTTELFCNFPLTSAQTLVANEYSHNAWQTDSSAWPQIAQLGSTGSLRLAILARVGRTSEQARQRKFRTFGGMRNLHILSHNLLSSCALECSTSPPWFKWRAIR